MPKKTETRSKAANVKKRTVGVHETSVRDEPADVPVVLESESDTQVGATEHAKKQKLIRDGFTMPEAEYRVLEEVKKACLAEGFAVKKSELLRVGVALLRDLDPRDLQALVAGLAPLKVGRPKRKPPETK